MADAQDLKGKATEDLETMNVLLSNPLGLKFCKEIYLPQDYPDYA